MHHPVHHWQLCGSHELWSVCSCKARLGSYNWAGSQSESGAWITPAFQATAPVNIRRPLVGQAQAARAEKDGMAEPTDAPTPDLEAAQQQTQEQADVRNQEKAVTALDAARTVSDAAHAAAQIDAEMTRPTIVPGNGHRLSLRPSE